MSVIQTTDGRFKVDFRPHGRNGKRIIKLFATKADAVSHEKDLQAQYGKIKGSSGKYGIVTMRDILSKWMLYKTNVGAISQSYRTRVMTSIKAMDGVPNTVLDLDADHKTFDGEVLQRYLTHRTTTAKNKVRKGTVMNDCRTLMSALHYALPRQRSLFKGIKIVDNTEAFTKDLAVDDRRTFYVPKPDEIQAVFDNLPSDEAKKIFYFLLAAGSRVGEVCELKPENVNDEYITFRQGVKFNKPHTIHVPDDLPFALDTAGDYVFTQPNGSPWCSDRLNRVMKAAQTSSGSPHFTVHDLRHAYVVYSLVAGVNPKVIQTQCNWRTISMVDYYNNTVAEYNQYKSYLPAWSEKDKVHKRSTNAAANVVRLTGALKQLIDGIISCTISNNEPERLPAPALTLATGALGVLQVAAKMLDDLVNALTGKAAYPVQDSRYEKHIATVIERAKKTLAGGKPEIKVETENGSNVESGVESK